MNATTQKLLDTLAELIIDTDVITDTYGIKRSDDAPLDNAFYVWVDAGMPDSTVLRDTEVVTETEVVIESFHDHDWGPVLGEPKAMFCRMCGTVAQHGVDKAGHPLPAPA